MSPLPHPSPAAAECTVRLQGPLDVPASLEFFRRWGDDGMDRWDGHTLVRTLPVGSRSVAYACTISGAMEEPVVRLRVEDAACLEAVAQAVRRTFMQPPPDYPALLRDDPLLARLDARYAGQRPVLQFDLLAALVHSISAQQVNMRWAITTSRRLAEAFGDLHRVGKGAGEDWVYSLAAARLAAARPEDIRALQFTTRKAEYLVGLAQAIAGGELGLDTLAALPDEEVIARLTALRGIGVWTAEWILVRALGRPRVVAGDLAVRKAVGIAYLGLSNADLPPEAEVRRATAHWGGSAAVAQALLLRGYIEGALAL